MSRSRVTGTSCVASPRARRAAAGAVLAVCALAVLVGVGRWERARSNRAEIAGMERVARLVGPLDQPQLSGYRIQPGFDCLVYRRGVNPFALELCVDAQGRLVEAIDRRTTTRHIYSLRYEPGASTVRVSPTEVAALLRRMGAKR
jgi:hypothetical protein